jgi:hypothetical protein
MPSHPGVGHPLRGWFEFIELFSHGGNSELATEDGTWEAHEVSWGAVVYALGVGNDIGDADYRASIDRFGPMSKEGRGGERLTAYYWRAYTCSAVTLCSTSDTEVNGDYAVECPLVNYNVVISWATLRSKSVITYTTHRYSKSLRW